MHDLIMYTFDLLWHNFETQVHNEQIFKNVHGAWEQKFFFFQIQ